VPGSEHVSGNEGGAGRTRKGRGMVSSLFSFNLRRFNCFLNVIDHRGSRFGQRLVEGISQWKGSKGEILKGDGVVVFFIIIIIINVYSFIVFS